ncbi:DsbA family protein [Aureimonas psammosilenae]|uniref:DsbA family protein n=1 Tax=Aureimonas psammosilenae TaxID=2495496 RepID=UPI001260E876|nr:thioredoxin domain-containing protein [Aureimonas psammosilenae]
MNRRTFVVSTVAVAAAVFAGGAAVFRRGATAPEPATAGADHLVRAHSPVVGKADAKVTVAEFFDPSCEACRAFHPILEQILGAHPEDVRLVLRYAPLHDGSDEAVKILEASRRQDKFDAVLDALFERQPEWAVHGAPNLAKAWEIAGTTGLDLERARKDAATPEVEAVLRQDVADMDAAKVDKTPTFFVNGRAPAQFGPQPLYDMIVAEIAKGSGTT